MASISCNLTYSFIIWSSWTQINIQSDQTELEEESEFSVYYLFLLVTSTLPSFEWASLMAQTEVKWDCCGSCN